MNIKENNFKGEKGKDSLIVSNNPIAKYFGFGKMKTTFKKEIIGGISTLLSMIYILSVEPGILSGAQSINDSNSFMNADGVFLATAIMSFLATFVMGIAANVPIALAPSMGVNAMFTFSVANSGGLGYEGALIATSISGIMFCIISVTKLRTLIIKSLPKSLHLAIGVGIGFFIAYVGIANIGWVQKSEGGLPIAELSNFKLNYPEIILGSIVLLTAIFLNFKKFFAPVAVVMVIGFIIAIILANTIDNHAINQSFGSAKWDSNKWNYAKLFKGFASNISSTWSEFTNTKIWSNPTMYVSIFVFIILTFFDATGTITAVNVEMNRESGVESDIPQRALIIDGASTIVGASIGVSNIACYAESCVGVSQGARTGFASLVTSMGLLLSIVIFPIFQMMPSCITGAATVFIGTVVIKSITGIEWNKPEMAIAAFFSILFMIITYNIANGIALAIIAYTVGSMATGKLKEIGPVIWSLDVIFILYFIANSFI